MIDDYEYYYSNGKLFRFRKNIKCSDISIEIETDVVAKHEGSYLNSSISLNNNRYINYFLKSLRTNTYLKKSIKNNK